MIALTPKQWIAAAIAGALVITLALFLLLRGGSQSSEARTAAALAAGLAGAMNAAETNDANNCARLAGFSSKTLKGGDTTLVLGVVADTRGARQATLQKLVELRKKFDQAGVELIVTLGGLGTTAQQIQDVLGVLAKPSGRLVLAIPGDREAIEQHRTAVAALAKNGALVLDGSRTRFVMSNGVSIGTFPGVAKASQLVARSRGCVHSATDASAFATELASKAGPRVWAGYAPPRQRSKQASDITNDGIHIGERELRQAVHASKATVVLHGLVDEAATGTKGDVAIKPGSPLILAAGAADALPVELRDNTRTSGTALVLWISPERIRWTRL